jgi:DNA polymerase III epsilon subunit family exonuclease
MDGNALERATFAVVDVETTGLDCARDAVVEIACLRVERGTIAERFVSLVDPQRPIPARASSVHGIFDRDVRGAPTLAGVRERVIGAARGAVVVAHNARFDLGFLPFLRAQPALCTMRLAKHLIDAPSYRNEALRALLGIEMPPEHGPAHRAGADAAVTAEILVRLLRRYGSGPFPQTVDGLIATIAKPASLGRFAFGAHRGTPVARIPSGYLRWIVRTGFEDWPDVRATAERELDRRRTQMTA